MIHLGSIYLIVKDFEKSVDFYEKLLDMTVSSKNMTRFAQFEFEGHNISLMNGLFDSQNPDKVVHKGEKSKDFDSLEHIAMSENTHKFVLNFWIEDLRIEHERLQKLGISDSLTNIKYVYNVSPYYYFQLTDPDGNVIEITGGFSPINGEF